MKYVSSKVCANKFIGLEIPRYNLIDINKKKDLDLAKVLFYYKKKKF